MAEVAQALLLLALLALLGFGCAFALTNRLTRR